MSKGTGAEKKEGGAPAASHEQKKAEAPAAKGGKGHNPGVDGCHSWGCKAKADRFNFCLEHYDHFKFGLVKKTGEPVPDYEKKFEHYLAYKQKRGAHKVA